MTIDKHIGRRINLRRKSLGLTLTAIGAKLGVSFQMIGKYENGASRVTASRLWQLCQALDVEPGYFFHGLK